MSEMDAKTLEALQAMNKLRDEEADFLEALATIIEVWSRRLYDDSGMWSASLAEATSRKATVIRLRARSLRLASLCPAPPSSLGE